MEEFFEEAGFKEGYTFSKGYGIWLCLFAALYGYFAFGFDSDPESCYANSTLDPKHRLQKPPGNTWYDDPGWSLRFGFGWLFFLIVLEAAGSVANRIYYKMKEEKEKEYWFSWKEDADWYITWFLMRPLLISQVVAWVYLFIIRFKETGKICSGDYLGDEESTEGYLNDKGQFLEWYLYFLIVFAIVSAIAFVGLVIWGLYLLMRLLIECCNWLGDCLGARR